MRQFLICSIVIFSCFAGNLLAQQTNSPYSQFGIGMLSNEGLARARGMGGMGVSNTNILLGNYINPALMPRTRFTIFDVGLQSELKNIETGQQVQENGNASLSHLQFVFPFGRLASSIGIKRYSEVSFNTQFKQPYINNPSVSSQINLTGSGGLNRFFFSNGFRLTDDVYIGLETSYIFGKIEKETTSILIDENGSSNFTQSTFLERVNYRGFSFKPGFAVRKELKAALKTKSGKLKCKSETYNRKSVVSACLDTLKNVETIEGKSTQEYCIDQFNSKYKYEVNADTTYQAYSLFFGDVVNACADTMSVSDSITARKACKANLVDGTGVYFNLGGTYELSSDLNSRQLLALDRQLLDGTLVSSDTLSEDRNNSISLPSTWTIGFSFDKPSPAGTDKCGNPRKAVWSIGADFSMINWTDFSHFGNSDNLENGYRISVGGEWIPDIANRETKAFFQRVVYRMGAHFEKTGIVVEGQNINELALDLGISLPIGDYDLKYRLPKYVNFAFSLGTLGTTENNLVRESFFKTTISFTVNNKWFTRRKVGL